MNWFRNAKKQDESSIHTSAGERVDNLYWTALIITGNQESARQSIIDAGALVQTESFAFCDWLVRWGRSATARAAVNAVRSSIHKTAAQYAAWACRHRSHLPLSPAQAEQLRGEEAYRMIDQLDVLARTALVLYGCQQASLSECALLLDIPLPFVVAAYCRAQRWHHEFTEQSNNIQRPEGSGLYLVRYDSDGVPLWDSVCPPA